MLGAATVMSFALFLHSGEAKEKITTAPQVLDVGKYHVTWVPAPNWEANVKREADYAVFQFIDKPAMTTAATIGVFRTLVPVAARAGDRRQIADAFASADVMGAQKALFKTNVGLVLRSKRPTAVNGGQLFSYVEPIEAGDSRANSTKFFRAWVFFPENYAQTGALYLVLGKEVFQDLESRPDELEKAGDIIAGVREP